VEITRNIVQDLLPLYLAGEASPETRVLVEEFLARDPALAAEAARQKSGSVEKILTGGTIMPLPQDHEAETLARTRAKLQRTAWILALAIAFTLVPFSFTFDNGHITWMMVRDVPHGVRVLGVGSRFLDRLLHQALPPALCRTLIWVSFSALRGFLATKASLFPGSGPLKPKAGLSGEFCSTSSRRPALTSAPRDLPLEQSQSETRIKKM